MDNAGSSNDDLIQIELSYHPDWGVRRTTIRFRLPLKST